MSRYIDADALEERVLGNGLRPVTEQIFLKLVADAPTIKTKTVKYFDENEKVWTTGEVIVDA